MQDEIPLEPEQLAMVFDSLDSDGNGYLTFDEFIQGFGKNALESLKLMILIKK